MRRRDLLHGIGVAGSTWGFGRASAGIKTPALTKAAEKELVAALAVQGASPGLRLTRFEGSHPTAATDIPFPANTAGGTATLVLPGITIACDVRAAPARDRRDAHDIDVTFRVVRGRLANASVAVTLTIRRWSRDAYVVIPGAIYGGNRFASRHIPYPPLASEPSDIGPHVPPIASDIPRLNSQPGESGVVLTAVDAALPAIGVRVPGSDDETTSGHGFILLGDPSTSVGLTGLSIAENIDRTSATLSIASPGVRPDVRYGLCNGRVPSFDQGADLKPGSTVGMRMRLLSFACPDVQTLFDRLYEARRDRVGRAKLRHALPLSAAKRMIEERLVVDQWTDLPGIFMTRSPTALGDPSPENFSRESTFRTGADGAMALAVPAMSSGGADARRRAAAVLDFQLTGQAASGLFHAASNSVDWWDEGEGAPPPTGIEAAGGTSARSTARMGAKSTDARGPRGRRWTHIGRSVEALHLACRQILLSRKIDPAYRAPDHWRAGVERAANAVVRLWNKYQQLGQYINCDTGDVVIGGSTAGALAPAALVLVARVLETARYDKPAAAMADAFYTKFVRAGLTLGGAPAALQSPDSRSAAGLLESFVALGETTGEEIWFARAAEVAHQLATWVVAWDVPLPSKSTLGKMDARTTGAVLVSAQDKWALPGFAGLSGDALFRLYRATGQVSYLELLRETVHNSSGYVDPEDRRPDVDSKSGWVAGRISMGDAMGAPGDVPAASPAGTAQAICLMAGADIPSIYVQPDTGFFFPFDHIEARLKQRNATTTVISITNPTRFEAELRVFAELDGERSRPLDPFPMWGARMLTVGPAATAELEIPRAPR